MKFHANSVIIINFMQFKKIVGQQKIIDKFIHTVEQNRISHAQLFTGQEGSGKLMLAIAYAQYISCKNRSSTDSCGECSSCKKFEKLVHPDLHFVFPVARTKKFDKPVSDNFLSEWRDFIINDKVYRLNAWLEKIGSENAQAGIFAHESNSIIKKLSLKSYEGEYKIMIIWLPEKMNSSSANKLLKMIEEPPPKTLFMMVSDYPEQIINTIRSRSQFVKIPRIDNQSIFDYLVNEYQLAENQAMHFAKISNGNLFKAIDQISISELEKYNFDMFVKLMRLCFGVKIIEIVAWVDDICKNNRERQKSFISFALRMFRENFIKNIMNNNEEDLAQLNDQEREFSSKFYTFVHHNNIAAISSELNLAYKHVERNGTGKIIFLDMALKLTKLLRAKK